MTKRTIAVYDSLGGSNTRLVDQVEDWLQLGLSDEAAELGYDVVSPWHHVAPTESPPRQENGCARRLQYLLPRGLQDLYPLLSPFFLLRADCGAFVLAYIERLSVQEPLSFSQEDMEAIRISIGASLIEARFQTPEGNA